MQTLQTNTDDAVDNIPEIYRGLLIQKRLVSLAPHSKIKRERLRTPTKIRISPPTEQLSA